MGRLVRISDAKGPRSFGTGPRTEKQEPQVKPTPALPRADLTGLAYEALRSGTLPMTTPAGRVTVPTGAAAQRASMLRDYAQLADDQKRDRLEGELYQLTQPGRVYNQETTQRNRARAAEIQGELDGLLPRESGRFKSGVQSILSAGLGAVPAIAATAKSLDWSIGEERNRAESRQLAELDRKIRALEGSRRGDALDHIRGTDEWKALDAQRRALSLQANPAVDMDDPGMRLMRESNQYREQALEGLEGVPRFLGGTALSIGQNAALLPLAAVNPALPLAAMGTISAADKMYELGERGLPASEALSRGLISGGIEAATEKIPLDTLLDAMKTGGKGALRNILHQAGTEAGEESVSYLANYLVDKAYKDPEAEFSLAELAQAAAGGALSGGVFGGFGSAYNAVGERLDRPAEMGTGRTEGTEETDPSAFGLRMTREERAQDDGAMVRDDGAMAQNDGRATPKNVVRIKGADIGRTDGTDVGRTGAADALSALAEETARERTEAVFAAADAQAAQETAAAEDRAIRSQRQESPFPVQETPGRETTPPSSTAQDRTQEPADALIATLGENGQKAFRAAYQAGGDLPAAFREFSHAYRQGVNGAAETDVAAGRQVNTLSAYYAGQNDAALSLKREKKAARFAQTAGSESGLVYDDFVKEAVESGRTIVTTEGERAVYLSGEAAEQVNQVARRLGLRVRFVDSIDVNGQKDAANAAISGAEVQIQKNNPNPVRFLMGHEMTHRMQELAPKEYRAFRSAAADDLVVQRAVQDQMARHARRGISLSYEAALDEAAADYAGRLVQDGAVLDDFIRQHKENRSLLEKLRDAVRDLIRKLTGKDRAQAQTAEGKLTAALEAAAKRAEKLDAKKNTAQEGGKERFSINEEFRQELREWFEDGQPAGELFTLGSTGPVLQGLGAIESDIYMNGDKISTILEQHPEMSIREIQRIPEMLEDPTLILKSKGTGKDKNNSRMVLYGSIKAQNGQPVLAVLDLRPRESGFLLNDMQKVNSTYTKNNPASFVTGSDVLYADKKRTVPLLRQFGLTITSRQLLRNGSMGSITYDGDRVKMSGVPFSSVVDLGSGGRFSLKSPVEETENLIALHNLTEEKLWGDLRLGGFPMPSIAVTRTDVPHTNFGDITLVMDKRSIDPKANRKNTVYSADAWTPTFPQVEYAADPAAERRISGRLRELSGKVDEMFKQDLYRITYDMEDLLNRYGGEDGLLRQVMDNYGLKAAYLEDAGHHVSAATVQREADKGYSQDRVEKYRAIVETLGTDDPDEIGHIPLKELRDRYGDELETAFPGMTKSTFRLSGIIRQVQAYLQDQGGEPVYETVTDAAATRRAIDDVLDRDGYERWVRELYSGVQADSGIYNNKERFTPAGNRRTFQQTHYPVTLENIVKAMKGQNGGNTKNVSGFYGVKSLRAGTAKRFKSIADMHKLEGRLQNLTEEQTKAIHDELDRRLMDITEALAEKSPNGKGSFDYYLADSIGNMLVEIADGEVYTIDAIMGKFNGEYGFHIGNELAAQVRDLLFDVSQMPVNIFEAKPERAVGFDEVLAAVLPDDASGELRDALSGRGVNVLTYKAGDDADRIAKVNSVEGARFSLKEDTVSKNYAAILEENELLRERVDYWKGQTKQTRQPTTDKKAVDRAARDLVKAYSADLDAAEIAGELQALYDAMASGKRGGAEYSGEAASRDAGAIARKLVESAIVDDDTLYQDYSDLRQFLKGTKLTISETDAADVLDYNDLRKRNFGRAVISKGPTNVDQVYQELSERWPEFFDEARDTHPADQLQRIDDVLGEVYRIGETNPYAASMEEAVTGAANEILETFFDLPQTRKTFADRQAQKLDAARAKGQAQVQKVRAQRDARLAELREQNRVRTAKAVERERTRREEQVARLRSRYEARDAAGRERRSARELRAKIVRHAKALSQKLLRPTDKQHVPEDLRTAVAAMLESINLESAPGARSFTVDPVTKKRIYQPEGTPTKRTEAFLKLKEQYQKIIEDGSSNMVLDPTLFGDAAENIKGSFDQVISMRDIRLADMNMEQLQTVWNVVRAVERSIATAGEAISDSKYTEIAAWANDLDRDTKGRKPKETLTETGLLKSLENPYTFFSHYGESGMAIYRMLRDAQDQQQVMRGQVEEAAAKIVDPKTVEKLEKETKTFELENGDKLTLTTAQVMEIYELMKRKQAYNHLLKGGIVQPKVKSAKIRRGKEAIHLTTGDLGQIAQSLTEEEIRIADGLQRLTNGLLAGYGNEASMKVYGYKKFTEDNYWPIHSSKEGIYARPENSKGNVRAIKNIGLAKTTVPHASNALDIGSIFDTFAAHAGDMIDYAAWLAPMEDAVRLFNFKFRTAEGVDTGRSVKGILDQYGGAGSQEYWSRLMENIQNGISASSKDPLTDFAAKGIGSFKGAAVGGNLRVVLQQPTAILRASAVLSPADMSKGLASGATKGSGWKKAVKWSPIAQRKAAGGFDISSPVQMKESLFDGRTAVRKLNDLLSSPAGKADAATWGRIWNACEWTVARKRPGLTKGSDDFYRAVNQVFTDVIDQTQVVDGVLQRSNIMRSPSDMAKMATSFMGEPTMSLNMFLRAWDQMRYEQDPARRGKAIKNLGRVGTALVVTNLVNAFAQSLVDGIRDDDKEKGYWERVLKAFTGLTGEEENAWEKAVSVGLTGNAAGGLNPLGMVPYLRDVLSLMQGYEVARTDTEVLSALVRAGTTAIKSAGGNGPKTRAYAAKEVAAAGAKLFGIPVSNITRDVWSMVRTIAQGTGNLELQYAMERAINNIGYSGNQGKYYTLAFQALQAGNTDLYRRITADLIAQGVKASSIESAMNKRLEDAVKKDPAFALSREAQDLIGARTAYAPEEEKEAAFGPNDLSPEAYNRYSGQRAKTYRAWADELEGNQRFQRLDDTAKDKVLTAAADLAEDLALRDHSGGKYQDADLSTWERWAAGGTGWGVDPVEALLFRAAYDMAESEIKDGKTVPGSKKENALELAETLLPRLSDRELEYLMSYYWSPEDKKLDKLKENKFLT